MSEDFYDKGLKDARILAARINSHDYETLKIYWDKKSYSLIAYMLRRYGLEFMGLTYLETLITELFAIKEKTLKE